MEWILIISHSLFMYIFLRSLDLGHVYTINLSQPLMFRLSSSVGSVCLRQELPLTEDGQCGGLRVRALSSVLFLARSLASLWASLHQSGVQPPELFGSLSGEPEWGQLGSSWSPPPAWAFLSISWL